MRLTDLNVYNCKFEYVSSKALDSTITSMTDMPNNAKCSIIEHTIEAERHHVDAALHYITASTWCHCTYSGI